MELVRQINNELFPDLIQTYQTLKNSGASDTKIYVVGYPQLVKLGGNCGVNVQLDSEEVLFSKQLINYLNSVIKLATAKAGVFYVDAEDALNGHLLCEAQPGSVAVNGITAGHDRPFSFGPIGTETYHPNDLGHQLLENKILMETNNLTAPMPTANLNIVPPVESGLEFLKAPKSGRTVSIIHYNNDLSGDTLTVQAPFQLNIDGARYAFKPSATYSIELHSNFFSLGTFNTDANGNLSAQIRLPQDVPDGVHKLHVLGSNINGEAIDVYKFVYVVSEEPVTQQPPEDASSTDSTAVTTNDSSTQVTNGTSEQLQPASLLSYVTSASSSPPVQEVNLEIQTATLAVQSFDTTPKIVAIASSPPAIQIISLSSESIVYVEPTVIKPPLANQEQKQASAPVVLGEKTDSQVPHKNSSNKSAFIATVLIVSLISMSFAAKHKTRNK